MQKRGPKTLAQKKFECFFLRYKKKGFHEGTANSRLVIIGALTDKKLTWKEGMND